LHSFRVKVFGISPQSSKDQKEAKRRLALPFELLNDSTFVLCEMLRLPTFVYSGSRLIKRVTIVATDGLIRKVFYPVFPPNRNAEDVIEWLAKRSA
jgi:peroxiredoxin